MDDTTLSLLMLFKERRILNLIQIGAILNVDCLSLSEPIRYLVDKGYVRRIKDSDTLEDDSYSFDTPFEITFEGIATINQAQKERKHSRYAEVRAWITLLIAIAAFVKSFFF